MDVGLVALAVGALLAAGILASLLAGRLRLPGLVLVLVLGMVIGTDGLAWIDFDDYEAAQSAAVIALALILYEGGLSCGWAEIRPVIGVSIALATIGTALTAGHHRGRRGAAVQRALHARGADPRLDRGRDRRRRRVRGAARIDAAAQDRAHAGGRVRRQRPDRRPARARPHRGHQARRTSGCSTRPGWRSPSWRSATAVGLAVGGFGVIVLKRVTLPSAGLYPVASVAFAGMAYGGARRAARLRLPRRLPRRPGRSAAPPRPPGARSSPSTRGSRGSPSSGSSCCSACS